MREVDGGEVGEAGERHRGAGQQVVGEVQVGEPGKVGYQRGGWGVDKKGGRRNFIEREEGVGKGRIVLWTAC